MASPKKAVDASPQELGQSSVEHNEAAVADLAGHLGEDQDSELKASTQFEALLQAQVKAKLASSGDDLIKAVPNPILAANSVSIAGREFGVGKNNEPVGGQQFVTKEEFKLLQEFKDNETGQTLLVDASEVSA